MRVSIALHTHMCTTRVLHANVPHRTGIPMASAVYANVYLRTLYIACAVKKRPQLCCPLAQPCSYMHQILYLWCTMYAIVHAVTLQPAILVVHAYLCVLMAEHFTQDTYVTGHDTVYEV